MRRFHNSGVSTLLPGHSSPEYWLPPICAIGLHSCLSLQASLECSLSLPLPLLSAFQNLSQTSLPPGSLPGLTPAHREWGLPSLPWGPLCDHTHPGILCSRFYLSFSTRLGVSQEPRQALFIADFSSLSRVPGLPLASVHVCLINVVGR